MPRGRGAGDALALTYSVVNHIRWRRFVLALLFLAPACHGRDAAGAGGGTLIVSSGADAETLFPPLAVGSQGRAVTELLYDKLADIGPALNTLGDAGFVPRLAQRWEWSSDSLTITFHLDPRARWHDGRAVTSRDVQYAFRVWTDSAVGAAQRSSLATIDSIATPDSLTARVHFRERTAEQFYSLVYTLIPLPAHRLAALPDSALSDAPEMRAPVGNGPFTFVSWTAACADCACCRSSPVNRTHCATSWFCALYVPCTWHNKPGISAAIDISFLRDLKAPSSC